MLNINKVFPDWVTFSDDGCIPNSRLPVVIYENAFTYSNRTTLRAEISARVARHGWSLEWEWRVYKYTHWHSTAHEALVCVDGAATLQLGGPTHGEEYEIVSGTVVIIPAGVAHRNLKSSHDFTVFGLYPDKQKWDLIKGARTFNQRARTRSARVPLPRLDPLFGNQGMLQKLWK